MSNLLVINPGDNPNEGRSKINYNFSIINGGISGSTNSEFTGGTVSGDTNFLGNLSGTTLFSGSTNLGDLFSTHDYHVTGVTFNVGNYKLNINQNDGSSYLADLSILSTDMTVTGGTYDPNTGIGTFSNNSGGTFQVSGFLTGYTDHYVTGGTFSAGTLTLDRQNGSLSVNIGNYLYLSGGTVTGNTNFSGNVSGGTYFSGSTPLTTIIQNIASQYSGGTTTSGNFLPLSGGTVTGNTNFSGNVSGDTYFSGSTPLTTIIQNIASQYSGGTTTSGNFLPLSGGTVTGNTVFTQGFTASTISATTYYGVKETGITPSIIFVSSPVSEYILDVSTSRTAKINLSNGANLNLKLSGITSAATGNIWLLQGSAGNSTLTLTGASYTNYVVNGGAGQISLSNSANAIDIVSYITDGVNVYWSSGYNYT